MELRLTNRTHARQIVLRLAKEGLLSKAQATRVRTELCNDAKCACKAVDRAYLDGTPASVTDDGINIWVAKRP